MRNQNHHSRSYHKFFEDWAEQRIFDENGKMHIERVYVGNYYRSPLSGGRRIARRVLYVLLYVLSVASFIKSGVKDIPANHAVVPSLTVAVCIFALALLAPPLCRNLITPEEMIVRQYRAGSLDLIRMSGVAAGALCAATVANLLFLIAVHDAPLQETLSCVLGYLVAAGFAYLLHLLEQRLDYEVLPPRVSRPENSTVIQFESFTPRFW